MHVRFGEERQGDSSTTPYLLLYFGLVSDGAILRLFWISMLVGSLAGRYQIGLMVSW